MNVYNVDFKQVAQILITALNYTLSLFLSLSPFHIVPLMHLKKDHHLHILDPEQQFTTTYILPRGFEEGDNLSRDKWNF